VHETADTVSGSVFVSHQYIVSPLSSNINYNIKQYKEQQQQQQQLNG